MSNYDMSIHTNPDAQAWAKLFCERYKVWSEDRVEVDTEGLMIGWFANAMMAMHDHLMLKGAPINGDHAAYLLGQEGTQMKFTPEQLENWKSYEEVRSAGEYNMFDRRAEEASGLSHDEYMFTMKNYTELAKEVNGSFLTAPANRLTLTTQLEPSKYYTTGHYRNHKQPGGCILHNNLYCRHPECD
jgi:hypothetical protein